MYRKLYYYKEVVFRYSMQKEVPVWRKRLQANYKSNPYGDADLETILVWKGYLQ